MGFNLLQAINTHGWGVFIYVFPFLGMLTLVVFVHELGHFLVARWYGVRVVTFSIGFGHELFGFNDRHGTRWKVSAIPLGGYVKFFGDENAASVPDQQALANMNDAERRESFVHQKVGPRAAIVAAGPIANFLLGAVIFSVLFMTYGKPPISSPQVDYVDPGSAAAQAGLQPGDLVLKINGRPIDTFSEMQRIVRVSAGQELALVVERAGQQVALTVVPAGKMDAYCHRTGALGIRGPSAPAEQVGPATAIALGIQQCGMIVVTTLSYLGRVAAQQESADQIGGPVGIARVTAEAAKLGFGQLMSLAAVLSVSIGLLNLFPVPLLDGGHLLFYGIEVIRRKPLSEQSQEYCFRAGLLAVLALMLFATYNDICRLPWPNWAREPLKSVCPVCEA